MGRNPSSSSSSATGGGSGSSIGGPCGACKFLRRKCVTGCIFAPYFDSEQGAAHFEAVHKVFGASNVSKLLLLHIPVHKRMDAVATICYEAQARLRDPAYGCVAHIFALQQQIASLQAEISFLQAHLATDLDALTTAAAEQPLIAPPVAPQLSITDLPTTYDSSSTFDPILLNASWPPLLQPQLLTQMDPLQYLVNISDHNRGQAHGCSSSGGSVGLGGDLQALAHELLQSHTGSWPRMPACNGPSSSSSMSSK